MVAQAKGRDLLVAQAKGKDPLVAQAKGRDPLVAQAKGETCRSLKQTFRVYSPAVTLLHEKGPRHRRKICANPLWLYSNDMQSSPSKNKNINHISIYLRVFRCMSSGVICSKNTRISWIVRYVTKILQIFWTTLIYILVATLGYWCSFFYMIC